MTSAQSYRPDPSSAAIDRHQLTPSGFGTELTNVDLATIDADGRSEALKAFHDSGGLLIIRNQHDFAPQSLRNFVAQFGKLEKNEKYEPAFLLPDYPEILRVGNMKEKGKYVSMFIDADPPPLLWHMDDSYRHPQPAGSCMYCVHTPPQGGETGFAGMSAAYQALSEEVKLQIETTTTIHSYDYLNERLRRTNPHRPPLTVELKQKMPPVRRPLVAKHPVTGRKALYIPTCQIESVEGMSEDEARPLLNELQAHATKPDFTYMHHWEPGDLVIWDNRGAMHAPSPFEDEKYQRLMYRLTFGGQQIVSF